MTTTKKINPMIIGEINFPKNIPNLNHILLSGERIFELSRPKIRKTKDNIKDHILISPLFKIG